MSNNFIRVGMILQLIDPTGEMMPSHIEKLRKKLTECDERTLRKLHAAAAWNQQQENPEPQFMYPVIITGSEQVIREAAFAYLLFTRGVSSIEARDLATGLNEVERYKGKRIDEITGVELDIVAAILNVTLMVYQYAAENLEFCDEQLDTSIRLRGVELQEIVANNYLRAEDIISYIEERGTADPVALSEFLENKTALASGVL